MKDGAGRRTLALLTCALAALVIANLTSCGGWTRYMPTSTTTSGKPRVALVMKSLANEFFKTMQGGAEAHQRAHAGDY
ncbi:MAG: hypothetical protein M3R15_06830, partial [Acidobacteriota bacterium]|nr:hypothetical protein [Acidobacteriota bacterium]